MYSNCNQVFCVFVCGLVVGVGKYRHPEKEIETCDMEMLPLEEKQHILMVLLLFFFVAVHSAVAFQDPMLDILRV